ncbi:hypothetical protein MNBD_NITROSPINAE02-351 [hydrothermal vent metagenome]|uniref:Response regulatory domain-containing protein n=1 Tax=hydrothermal vent metagenome TaxID=652676 RepID=A0A3B1CMW1_9ZZZZ
MRVLVVDDMGPMRRTVSNTLKGIGFTEIAEAKNGKEAWDKLMASSDIPGKNFELAIVDWNMQPLTGLDLLKMVRKDKRTRDLIFIMITAEQLQDNVIAAIQSGVDEYIIKPFTPLVVKEKFLNVTRRKVADITKEIDAALDTPDDDANENDKPDQKIREYRKKILTLFEISRWSAIIPLELGKLHFKLKEYDEAEKWLKKTLSIDFGTAQAHELLSKILKIQGKVSESRKELEVAVVTSPKSGMLKHKLGEAYLREGQLDKAIELFSESINLFREKNDRKSMAQSKNSSGAAKLAKGERSANNRIINDAVNDIDEAATLDPGLLSAHYNLMVAYKKLGQNEKAAESLVRIQSMEPENADGWIALGKAYLSQSEVSKAKFAFNKAAANDESFETYQEISTTLYRHKLYDDALPYLAKAAEINPSGIFSYNLRGIIFRGKKDFKAALAEYEKAAKLEPDNPAIQFNLGVAYYKIGKEPESLDYFRTAKRLDSSLIDADSYINLIAGAKA